jgi:hypothetical protein
LREGSEPVGISEKCQAKAAVVLFPLGAWEKVLPYHEVFVRKLRSICESEGVAIHDITDLLAAEDFGDSEHYNSEGVEKVQRAVTGLCLDHLRSAGLIPTPGESKGP